MNRLTAFFETDHDRERLQVALAVARARVQELEEKQLDTDFRSWREGLLFGMSVGALVTIGLWWLSSLVLA